MIVLLILLLAVLVLIQYIGSRDQETKYRGADEQEEACRVTSASKEVPPRINCRSEFLYADIVIVIVDCSVIVTTIVLIDTIVLLYLL